MGEERVTVEPNVRITKDSMTASMDIYPMPNLETKDLIYAIKEAEVFYGILEKELEQALQTLKQE